MTACVVCDSLTYPDVPKNAPAGPRCRAHATRHPAVSEVRTDELRAGDWVYVPYLDTFAEVAEVLDTGTVNYANEPILTVRYAEPLPVSRYGGTPTVGNSAAASSRWERAQTCEWDRGPDPASGCDRLVTVLDSYCPQHRAAVNALLNRVQS